MRRTQTFILRLLVDTECPNEMRGSLYSVADNAEYSFADAQELLAQLWRMASLQEPAQPDEEGATDACEP